MSGLMCWVLLDSLLGLALVAPSPAQRAGREWQIDKCVMRWIA